MTLATDSFVLPALNSSGFFSLRAPLDKVIMINEQYTCIGIRDLSDYIANNEDPQTTIYTPLGILDDYPVDLAINMFIVSLQNAIGHRIQIPAKYIITYPQTNGVVYRAVMLGVSLPSLPVNNDLSGLIAEITTAVTDILGVVPVIKLVETSRPVLVQPDEVALLESQRALLQNSSGTDRTKYYSLVNSYNSAILKITALEKYIKTKIFPTLPSGATGVSGTTGTTGVTGP